MTETFTQASAASTEAPPAGAGAIAPIAVREREAAAAEASVATVQALGQELAWLGIEQEQAQARAGQPQPGLAALCLSGGGIRSATFCLGALQALAQRGMLDKFHYLSTVSGGGYIGSWLSAWMHRAGQDAVIEELRRKPAASDVADPGAPASTEAFREPVPLRRLRSYTNYLSPVWGLSTDFLSLVATFVRNLALNWMVLVPLIAAVLMLPRLELSLVGVRDTPGTVYYGLLTLAAFLVAVTIAYVVADVPYETPPKPPANRFIGFCFVPLIAAAVLLSWLIAWDASRLTRYGAWWVVGAGAALQLIAMKMGGVWRDQRGLSSPEVSFGDVVGSAVSGAVGGWLLFELATLVPVLDSPVRRELYATWCVPALFVVFWGGGTIYTAWTSRLKSDHEREWWARASAWWLGAGLLWLLGFVLVVDAPRWLLAWSGLHIPSAPFTAGAGAALLGVATSAIGYWSKNGAKIRKQAETLLEATGLKLLNLLSLAFVVMLLVAMSIAVSCTLRVAVPELGRQVSAMQADPARLKAAGWKADGGAAGDPRQAPIAVRGHVAYSVVLEESSPLAIVAGIVLLAAFGTLMSWIVGVNTFSLHNMYGNRLARAYLGASRLARVPHWFTGFDPNDNPLLAECADRKAGDSPSHPNRLLHVINVALNEVKPAGDRLEWQQRMATSFTMTPLHCGSPVLGYVRTGDYGADEQGLSLGRAMAISGAAASPNMGYHTSKVVAFVMTFFNVRLGWWTPNTMPEYRKFWNRREPNLGVTALLQETLATAATDRAFVYLSDGGHFENLGLYEMVRRGCTRIVVVDASCDPGDEFEDLEGAIRKVRVDFGAVIAFDEPLPTTANARARKRRVAVGSITYANGVKGHVVYIKPVLTGDEPLDLTRFAAANCKKGKAFPHQPTSDQFFDESQFESYRLLGKVSVEESFRQHWQADWGNWPEPAPEPAAPAPSDLTIPVLPPASKRDGLRALLPLKAGAEPPPPDA